MIKDASAGTTKTALESDVIRDWLLEKKILSIALEGKLTGQPYQFHYTYSLFLS